LCWCAAQTVVPQGVGEENAAEAEATRDKERVRRERKAAKADAEEGADEVESGDPDEDSC
jgi:hypothetical protein